MAVLGLCRTAIKGDDRLRVSVPGPTSRNNTAEAPWRGSAQQRNPHAYDLDEAHALLDLEEGRAIAKTFLVVDELRRDLVRARVNFAAEGERGRAKLVEENDRNWLEFLAVLDKTFAAPAVADKVRDVRGFFNQLADADGQRDRGALLALLELDNLLYFERFGDKACCFEDFKPYTLSAYLDGHTHVSDTEPTLCRSLNVHKLRRHVLGADELSAVQETERALVYLRAYTAALGLCGTLPRDGAATLR
ncbi:hypothetical protein DFH11DRAFT_1730267 [Phellopilus nigrolimitatus]|nr:hypothetical protein DFH11DRAFT_1730267 [Phellopilus nigrolimitatus]